jgi:peptide/nickel transport system substrate-binding protein
VVEANHLLDLAGWTGRDAEGYRTKNGKRLSAEALISDRSAPRPVFAALQADARKVGFEIVLNQLPQAELIERRRLNRYQALAAGVWHTNTPDGLYILYHSNEIISEKRIGQNASRLRDAQLDDALERARRSHNPVLLKDLYRQAQKRLVELVPAVPLYENDSVIAYRKRVKGVVADTSHNTPFFTTVWVDQGDR